MKIKNNKNYVEGFDAWMDGYMDAYGATDKQKETIISKMREEGFLTFNDFLKIINNSSCDFCSDEIGFANDY